jgi:hypothetical protein
MIRPDVSEEMVDALAEPQLTALPIVHLDFANDPVYAWGGIGDLGWNNETWLGIGNLGEIGTIQSDIKGSIPSLELSLNHIDGDILVSARNQTFMGRRGRVWIGVFDEDINLISEPALFFAGEISNLTITDGDDPSINVVIDSRLALLKRVRPSYRTQEDHLQKLAKEGIDFRDRFFEFVPSLLNKTVYWGLKEPSPGRGGFGRGGSGGGFGSGGAGGGFGRASLK